MTASAPLLGTEGYRPVDDLFTPRQVRKIRRLLKSFDLPDDHAFFASPFHAFGPRAAAFDEAVKRVVGPRLRELVPGYRPFMVAVTSKGKRSPLPIKFHQDWTYTDERVHRPIFLWCPLVDVDERNGALRMVPGSHTWASGIRPSRRIEVTEAVQDQLAARSIAVPAAAGQAVAFDPATCHGSSVNTTDTPRPAITIALAPFDAQLVHFHLSDAGELTGAEVDDAFFTTHPYGTPPTGYRPISPWDRAVTVDDLAHALQRSTSGAA